MALVVATALVGCMVEQTPEAALRAAQADSAAAGYAVGLGPGGAAATGHIELRTVLDRLRRRLAGDDSIDVGRAPVVAMAPPTPVGRRPVARADTPGDSVRADTGYVGAASSDTTADASAIPATSARPEPDSLLSSGEFLAYNPARHTVRLRAVAGHNGVNESLNFNGAIRGSRTVVVPLGWSVDVEFRQEDEALAHSALVAALHDPMPVDAPPPAFAGGATRRTTEGIIQGGTDAFAFAADRAGRYVIQCGVPGHAQAGMWIRLVVDSTAVIPRYR